MNSNFLHEDDKNQIHEDSEDIMKTQQTKIKERDDKLIMLRNEFNEIQAEVRSKDERINELESGVARMSEEIARVCK